MHVPYAKVQIIFREHGSKHQWIVQCNNHPLELVINDCKKCDAIASCRQIVGHFKLVCILMTTRYLVPNTNATQMAAK